MRQLWLISLLSTLLSTMAIAQSIQGPHGAVNFQNVNVCPARQTSPKPCSRTSKLNYNVTASTTFGETKVVTQGTPNLDFTLSATTCKGTLAAGSSCTVTAKFAPQAAGVRMGAAQLADSSGNLLVSTYVYGIGQGPVAAFNPGARRNLPVTGYTAGAMAVDAAGDVYFPAGGDIAKFDTRTGVQTTVATGVQMPYALGLALDGAGNIFVSRNGVVKIAAGTGVETMVAGVLNASAGVAVDGRGNLYVADDWDIPIRGQWGWPRLAEVSAATGGEGTLLTGWSGDQGNPFLNYPWGVAVDSAGNAYIACFNYGPVFESIAGTPPESGGGIFASRQFTQVGNFSNPSAVAVDAAGDVFVADESFGQVAIYEVAANNGYQTIVVSGPWSVQIALDAAGNLFFPPSPIGNILAELKGSQPATLSFGKIAVGSTSAAQSVTIQNVGNQTLNAVAPGLIVGANFLQVPGSGTPADCSNTFSLTPGASCNLSIVFAPQSAGTIKGAATFTDNALNRTPSATQSVKLKGIGVQ